MSQGWYCNTCEKTHKVGEVCKFPRVGYKDLQDEIKRLKQLLKRSGKNEKGN